VVYKGFLLFYRDEGGVIKNAYSMKSSSESLSKIKQATQVKLTGCFDTFKTTVEIPTSGQSLTKKKNTFTIKPLEKSVLLLQDSSGGEKAWVEAIKVSCNGRRADEASGFEESGKHHLFVIYTLYVLEAIFLS